MIALTSRALALAFLAGPWNAGSLLARAREALETEPRWLRLLVRRVMARFPSPPAGGARALSAMLLDDAGFREAASRWSRTRVKRWLVPETTMIPVSGAPAAFGVPPLPTEGDLARALGLTPLELAWFADWRRLNEITPVPALSHYRCQWVAKAGGGYRLLEAPKPRLRERQRWSLRNVLAAIPPSPHAHGFVPGRDVRSFTQPHSSCAVVVRLDIEDFFASVSRARVAAIFRRCFCARPANRPQSESRSSVDSAAASGAAFARYLRRNASGFGNESGFTRIGSPALSSIGFDWK